MLSSGSLSCGSWIVDGVPCCWATSEAQTCVYLWLIHALLHGMNQHNIVKAIILLIKNKYYTYNIVKVKNKIKSGKK